MSVINNTTNMVPEFILPKRHYNAPCRVTSCNSVIGLTTLDPTKRKTVICGICRKAQKIIITMWKKYLYKKRIRALLLITHRLLNYGYTDINFCISRFLM